MNNYGNGGACINFVLYCICIFLTLVFLPLLLKQTAYGSIHLHMRRNHWFVLIAGDF